MKSKLAVVLLTLVSSIGIAQGPPPGVPGLPADGQKHVMVFKRELGAWWKNSKIAEKLQLTDSQIKQLEDAFYQHRLKLIDNGAEMEKADMKLQQMMDADTVDEAQVNAQVDQVLAARGKMEREFTMMTLNFRRILTPDQWKQLRAMHPEAGEHDRIFMRRGPGGGPAGGGPGAGGPTTGGPQGALELPEIPEAGADCTTSEANGMKIVRCTKNIEITTDTEQQL